TRPMVTWIKFQSFVLMWSISTLYVLWRTQLKTHAWIIEQEDTWKDFEILLSPVQKLPLLDDLQNTEFIQNIEDVFYKKIPASKQKLILGDPTSQHRVQENR
ncbi:unnamed protein product, partial [Meganyctiphanes norvegica]